MFDLILFDRIQAIKTINSKVDLENNAYISFSGGKDSTVLHYLIDLALPNNNIPRVFINTGIEYKYILEFVKELQKNDNRIVIIQSKNKIKDILDKYGYPFKSKEHSLRVNQFNKGSNGNYLNKYLGKTNYKGKYMCPKLLLYQFQEKGKYNYSNLCCYKLKKEPIKQWEKDNHRKIAITGMRAQEGGNRTRLGCIINDKNGNIIHFHPLIHCNEDFINNFVDYYNIKLCKLYYPPFNFNRTGCKGCPFSLDLEKQLKIMELYLPFERKQCEYIWSPVYNEYRRLNYRLRNIEQGILF